MPRNASRCRAAAPVAVLFCLFCAAAAQGQQPARPAQKRELPNLQFLPTGSVLKGISMPRYVDHRVSALFTAERMEIKSRSLVHMSDLLVHLYDKDGLTTDLATREASYDFALPRATSTTPTSIVSPRFEAKGAGVVFDSSRNIGILKGPVTSAIRSANAGAPANPENKQ